MSRPSRNINQLNSSDVVEVVQWPLYFQGPIRKNGIPPSSPSRLSPVLAITPPSFPSAAGLFVGFVRDFFLTITPPSGKMVSASRCLLKHTSANQASKLASKQASKLAVRCGLIGGTAQLLRIYETQARAPFYFIIILRARRVPLRRDWLRQACR